MKALKNPKLLIIFEMANNHFGSLEHGKLVIEKFSKFLSFTQFDFAIKFQYRDLDTLIHNDYKFSQEIKYIKRFMDTRMSDDDFISLKEYATNLGFKTVCTPFDEFSAKKVVLQNYDYLKIASASFTDWPLLEEVVKHSIPVIASTAGANSVDLRRGVSFLSKRVKNLTLMHCVAEYPTSDNDLRLDRIDLLKSSFGNLTIGYSAHERPDNFEAVKIAYAKGARVFEKHIGFEASGYHNNEYSCSVEQIGKWIESLIESIAYCTYGINEENDREIETLNSLRRGVYANCDLTMGQNLLNSDIFFAMPTKKDQLLANDWSKLASWTLLQNISKGQPIFKNQLQKLSLNERIEEIAIVAKNMCSLAGVVLPNMINFEVSHHYGLDSFEQFGLVMATVVNRDYCKKILVIFPNQTNPEHFHKIKEESFYCLSGEVKLTVENDVLILKPGDLALIPAGKKHTFFSAKGAVVEEISSTSTSEDSYYSDPKITANKLRKSSIAVWS
jgi:sialic acid synthase SpsE/mannose-6-phosphate isomerase-like protein (cupin superfamily)